MDRTSLPVAVIGAGPVGLAAAAHLLARGIEPIVFEAGPRVGHHLRAWAHVRMFSPWEFNVDGASRALLERHGWTAPAPAHFPTGAEVIEQYLEPLARTPELSRRIRYERRVVAIGKHRLDRMKDSGRDAAPFAVRTVDAGGVESEVLVRAVIDATGTWQTPNPLGSGGVPVIGERANAGSIAHGIPDVLGAARDRYAGKRVLVVGSGHSAFNALGDLAKLADTGTTIHWAIRRDSAARVLGGGENDALLERGRLGARIGRLVQDGSIVLHAGFRLDRIERSDAGLVAFDGGRALPPVDEIVGATGFRPDHSIASELRLDVDPSTETTRALAPLIDPNLHSCGTVRPHGAEELRHPDADYYAVGMKSYGRAPTFLLLTGYEQVRSVVAAIAGDWDAARRVELVLPETGVCNTQFAEEDAAEPVVARGCCAPPKAPARVSCCA